MYSSTFSHIDENLIASMAFKGKKETTSKFCVEYYPFGLQTANSWTRDNSSNNFLYNEGSELNSTTGMYDLPFRNYDAALGRFFQVDALAHTSSDMTPYHYAGNNPVGANDPMGLMKKSPWTDEQENNAAHGISSYWGIENYMSWSVDGGGNAGSYGYGSGSDDYHDPYGDAMKVKSGKMSPKEYAAKYGDVYITSPAGGSTEYGDGVDRPQEDWEIELVSAKEILAQDPKTQNANYRARAYAALHPSSTSGGGIGASVAGGLMLAIQVDWVTPEPTDALLPKWIAEGILYAAAAGVLYLDTKLRAYTGTPWTGDRGFEPNMNGSNGGPEIPPEAAVGAALLYKILDLLQDSNARHEEWDALQKYNVPQDATKVNLGPRLGPR